MDPLVMALIIPFSGAFAAYLAGRIARRARGESAGGAAAGLVSAATLLAAGIFLLRLGKMVAGGRTITHAVGPAGSPFTVVLRADALSVLLAGVALFLGFLAVIYSVRYLRYDNGTDKFHPVMLLMLGAMAGLAFAADMMNLFVFYELMSVASFVLVSFRKAEWEPVEAGFKYIVLSCVGSFLLLLGLCLIFMYTGETNLGRIAAAMNVVPARPKLLMMALVIAGFGVKAALVPLHTWLPDAHTAAPSSVSALLSGIVIQTGLFAMVRVLLEGFGGSRPLVGTVFMVFGALTMTVGNLTALPQTDLKRLLAYSSIAQMGYILLGLGLGLRYGVAAGLDGGTFHLMTHAFAKGLAFLSAGILIDAIGTREISAMRGLGRRYPLASAALVVAGLGLAGVPPSGGFMSKLLVYEAGFKTMTGLGYLLACLAILNSVLSLGYYLPVMATLFVRVEGNPGRRPEGSPVMLAPLFVLALLTVVLGVWPEIGLQAVYPAVQAVTRLVGVI